MSAPPSWERVLPGTPMWSIERKDARGFSLRSVAVELRDGGVAVVSPIRALEDDAVARLAELGPVRFLVAPNHYHHLGLATWRARFPDARVVCTPVARPRLARKAHLEPETIEALSVALPPVVQVLVPPGLKTGELWLRLRTPDWCVWVVSDGFFHLPALPRGAIGMFCRVTGTAPGLRIGGTFLALAVSDRRAYREWLLRRIAEDRPLALVPGHGDVLFADDLSERLAALATARLR